MLGLLSGNKQMNGDLLKTHNFINREQYIIGLPGALFSPSSKKKIHPEKISYISRNGNPEKIPYIFFKKSFLIFRKTRTPKFFFIFQKTKLSYISGKVYSEPWHNITFLYFGKSIIQNTNITELLEYLEQKAYSEPWYIYNPRHIQNTVKHLRWNAFAKINQLRSFKGNAQLIFLCNPKKSSVNACLMKILESTVTKK